MDQVPFILLLCPNFVILNLYESLLAYARVDSFNLNKGLNLMHKFVAKTEK